MNTKQLYLENFDITTCSATVVEVDTDEHGSYVVLDQTCFHPKGGGQDFDLGMITTENKAEIKVGAVFKYDGQILHYVDDIAQLQVGDTVTCQVDTDRRTQNTRLHSAGHLIDVAMSSIRPSWQPGKGAHYPHMSYVEYDGEVDLQTERDQLIADLETRLSELQQSITDKNTISLTDSGMRSVAYGGYAIECGGTHVPYVSEIGEVGIKSIKRKNGSIRISYFLR